MTGNKGEEKSVLLISISEEITMDPKIFLPRSIVVGFVVMVFGLLGLPFNAGATSTPPKPPCGTNYFKPDYHFYLTLVQAPPPIGRIAPKLPPPFDVSFKITFTLSNGESQSTLSWNWVTKAEYNQVTHHKIMRAANYGSKCIHKVDVFVTPPISSHDERGITLTDMSFGVMETDHIVNGSITLEMTEVQRDIKTVNGDIRLTDGSVVLGDVIFSENGWHSDRNNNLPRLVVDANSAIKGSVHLYRKVRLEIDEAADVGEIVEHF